MLFTGRFGTRVTGPGQSTFYNPDENRSALNNTFDLGVEGFFNKDWSARLQTYTYSLFLEERRQVSYTIFLRTRRDIMATSQGRPDRSGINRFGEDHIRPDYYEDEQGMRHSRVEGLGMHVEWSRDPRSESSREQHSGKGPKNFSRSDELLREEVCEAFLTNPDLDPELLDVSVADGIVTLNGYVRVREDRYLAEDLARDVSGVKDVVNLISRGKWDVGDDPGGLIKGLR